MNNDELSAPQKHLKQKLRIQTSNDPLKKDEKVKKAR